MRIVPHKPGVPLFLWFQLRPNIFVLCSDVFLVALQIEVEIPHDDNVCVVLEDLVSFYKLLRADLEALWQRLKVAGGHNKLLAIQLGDRKQKGPSLHRVEGDLLEKLWLELLQHHDTIALNVV